LYEFSVGTVAGAGFSQHTSCRYANRTTLPVEVAAGGTVLARDRVLAAGPVRSLPFNRRFRLS
jgi:hypothetical protein